MSQVPTADLVGVAWLKTVVSAGTDVATTLADAATWTGDLFVTAFIVPSTSDRYTPLRSPIVQVDVWGRPQAPSSKPPYNRANVEADRIRDATIAGSARTVTPTPGDWLPARVTDVTCERDPFRHTDDQGGLARYGLDLGITFMPHFA